MKGIKEQQVLSCQKIETKILFKKLKCGVYSGAQYISHKWRLTNRWQSFAAAKVNAHTPFRNFAGSHWQLTDACAHSRNLKLISWGHIFYTFALPQHWGLCKELTHNFFWFHLNNKAINGRAINIRESDTFCVWLSRRATFHHYYLCRNISQCPWFTHLESKPFWVEQNHT